MFLLTVTSETKSIKLVFWVSFLFFFQVLGLDRPNTDLISSCFVFKRVALTFIFCSQVNVFHWEQAGDKFTVG